MVSTAFGSASLGKTDAITKKFYFYSKIFFHVRKNDYICTNYNENT